MIFRKPPQHSLDTASEMAAHAIRIAYGFKHNKKYIPSESELEQFEQFERELWQHYCTARYILRCMYERNTGRPETPHEWHDNAVRDMKEGDAED